MARVTSKLQVTIPKAIAERYGIKPGEEIEWLPAGDAIRVVPPAGHRQRPDIRRRLELFDRATERQRAREAERGDLPKTADRGWTREDLYRRGIAD
jgi:AbrB family looped-hinge helix DNA binding protein